MVGRMKRITRFIILAGILSLSVAMPVLAAKIGVPGNPRWEGTKACWDEVEDAYQYQVVLYKDGVKTTYVINTAANSAELSGRMREKGKYTFKVRVRERISDEYGHYSSTSSAYTQTETISTKRKTSAARTTAETAEKNPGPGVAGKQWREDGQGWRYDNGDGTYLCGGWFQIDQKWYYFEEGGYLLIGWITVDGRTYYCHSDGSRVSGWSEIDGGYYYFDENGVYHPDIKNE